MAADYFGADPSSCDECRGKSRSLERIKVHYAAAWSYENSEEIAFLSHRLLAQSRKDTRSIIRESDEQHAPKSGLRAKSFEFRSSFPRSTIIISELAADPEMLALDLNAF